MHLTLVDTIWLHHSFTFITGIRGLMNSLSNPQNWKKKHELYLITPSDLFTQRPTRGTARGKMVDMLKSQLKSSTVPVPMSSFISRKRLWWQVLHLCGSGISCSAPSSTTHHLCLAPAFFPCTSSSPWLLYHCLFTQKHQITGAKARLPWTSPPEILIAPQSHSLWKHEKALCSSSLHGLQARAAAQPLLVRLFWFRNKAYVCQPFHSTWC